MFVLTHLRDNVRINPRDFRNPRAVAITDELNKKYANKVLHNVGLCIRVWDILDASDGIVHACQDGSYQTKVSFRLIVFRPFVGEIMVGKVAGSSPTDGVRVSMDFFDDITIPPAFLPSGTEFDMEEGVWVWKYEGNDLFMDKDEPIRFRVENEAFVDVGPVPQRDSGVASLNLEEGGKVAPYTLVASIYDAGLGLTSWWES